MCSIWQSVLRFAACYFNLEGQYTDFSGLTIPVKIGRANQVIPVALTFLNGKSFLFSSTLDRFDFQPSWVMSHDAYQSSGQDSSRGLGTSLQWRGRLQSQRLQIAAYTFEALEFHVVEEMPSTHNHFHEVGGIVSMGRFSPIMMNRIIRLRRRRRGDGGVEITSLGRRRIVPWPLRMISIPCSMQERWAFSAIANFGPVILGERENVVVDPSSLDILVPMRLWSLIMDRNPLLSRDPVSGRLYADPAAASEVNFSFEISPNLVVRLLNKSLRFPDGFASPSGPSIPLRIRLAGEVLSICIGKALLESYKNVYLDNIEGKIRLLPHSSPPDLGGPWSNHARSAIIVEDIFTDSHPDSLHALFNMDSSDVPLLLPPVPATSLDRGLVPWSFRSSIDRSSRKSYELRLARVNHLPLTTGSRSTRFRLGHANLVFFASRTIGVALSKNNALSPDPGLYLLVEIRIRVAEVAIRIQERGTLLDIPRPALAADGSRFDCSVCFEQIQAGQLEQLLPLCGHKFHAACIYPWFHNGQRTCPTCRAPIV